MTERFTIEILDKNNWLIEDTKTGETANPIDGTTNVLKGLISTLNKFNDENEQLKQSQCQLFDLIDNLCERADKVNRGNEFKWGAIMGLKTLKRELKGDVE